MTSILPFVAAVQNEAGASATFETDVAKTDAPSQTIPCNIGNVIAGVLYEITYRLNPTNAETYTFYLYQSSQTGNYESARELIYESAALRADDTEYRTYCRIGFNLENASTFYIGTNWTGVPGDTTGMIRLSGIAYL